MARRPIFIPDLNGFPFVKKATIDFQWHSGLSKLQAQKSIAALHEAAAKEGISPILEISSKSVDEVGVSLSAFNLVLVKKNARLTVECAYQGSKIFRNGGPYQDLYSCSSREAKTDERLRNSGDFIGYRFFDDEFPSNPITSFYDWLYLTALSCNSTLAEQLFKYQGFSDIAFNPQKSFNCQARAAALFVSLHHCGEIERALKDRKYYLSLVSALQLELPFS
ncbi:DarT1-associated NADAR antitoxin family protein [Leptolyngbya sp. NIES-2104]|uniref:DarT1-associated NADAR antitoxin family protein n=1 Tax=Leptolyngbya sp. NIES-2104 TaxID=1552121 RepID=UPI00073F3559|nr:hypothetical protein [Leptolyngbya sp. NIES-2104]